MTTVAITYEELAHRLGITVPSVQRMAKRRRWRKTLGSDGRARVHVPEDYLAEREAARRASPRIDPGASPMADPETDRGAAPVADSGTPTGANPVVDLADLVARLTAAEGRAGAAEGELKAVREERDRLLAQLSEERNERDRLTSRIDAAQDRYVAELKAVHERMAKTEHDRDRLTRELETHLQLPWWRRLFA